MPEGDTVWRAAKRLRAALEGQTLTRTDFRVPQHATVDLSGHPVDSVASRGKHLLIRVAGHSIHTHLKMEGVWDVHPLGTRWRRPDHTARLVLRTATHEAVGFSLGITEVVPTAREDEVVGHLGPDLLGPDWDLDEAVRRVSADPERPVFLALLDQRNLAGLGNEYVNELLFLSGLHPERPVGAVPDVRRVISRGRQMLDVNKDRVQRTFTGNTRSGQERWVYGRERSRCRRCGTAIRTGRLGDRPTSERNTFWCPACQPAP
jgi:endonuclease-8